MRPGKFWIAAAVASATAGTPLGSAVSPVPGLCDTSAVAAPTDPRSVALCWLVRKYASERSHPGQVLRRVVSTDLLGTFGQPERSHDPGWLESLRPLGLAETCSWRGASECPTCEVRILRVGEHTTDPTDTTNSRVEVLAGVTLTTEDWPLGGGFYQTFRLSLVRSGPGWLLVDSLPGEAS